MEVLYHDQLFGVRVRTRPTHHDLFLRRDMTPEDSLRLYLPRIRRLRVAIEEPQLISGTRDGRERLYTFKDKIRRLCSYLVNAHSLHELIIWSRVPLPLWHKTTFGKRPLPISDTYHVLELFGRLRNVQHVSLQDYEGVSFNEAADEKMKDVLLLMAGQSPRSAPHPVEALWDALPSFTAKLTGINVDDEVWLARCSRENRDLPGFEKAIQQMVDKEMARRKEVDRALAELYSVQQGGMKT